MLDDITIESIGINSQHLVAVKLLGKLNRNYLGFLPEGAYDDAAFLGRIMGAVTGGKRCVGYVLYRITKDEVSITHLCIDEQHRRGRVGTRLIQAVIDKTKRYRGIRLKCRPDFPASGLWPKLGFIQQGQVSGRSKDGKPLTVWRRDNGHATLFTSAENNGDESRISGAIDSNVFFDLIADENERAQGEESRALLADWLQDRLELVITDEIYNEIMRGDPAHRQETEKRALAFTRLSCTSEDFDRIREELRPLFPEHMEQRDWSDLHHLARSIAAGATYFVTRDERVLELFDHVQERYGMMILRPTHLIRSLDEIQRATEYQPLRLAESSLTIKQLSFDEEDLIVSFRYLTEQKPAFTDRVRGLLRNTQGVSFSVIFDRLKEPVALIAIERRDDHEFHIPLLRVRRSAVAPTIFRQLVRQALIASQEKQHAVIRFTETMIEEYTATALREFGFFESGAGWLKLSLYGVLTAGEVASKIQALDKTPNDAIAEWVGMLADATKAADGDWLFGQEGTLWPLKFDDVPVANYVIAIRPKWAEHLFDEGLAKQGLFGRVESLAMNTEGVYYRSARSPVTAPARVLWYVSEDSKFLGSKAIRACSRLDKVVVGKPKELFRENRRLGVYEWKEVFQTAKKSIENEIMALKFSGTELFTNPISWREFQRFFDEEHVSSTIQSPTKICNRLFSRLYKQGIGIA